MGDEKRMIYPSTIKVKKIERAIEDAGSQSLICDSILQNIQKDHRLVLKNLCDGKPDMT